MSLGILDLLTQATECFVLENDQNEIVGYAFVEEDNRRGFVELQDLAVLAQHRGKNGGRILMEAIMKKYRCIKLIARSTNDKLIDFYRKMGFQTEYRIENYYEINEDGLRMVWHSPDSSGSIDQ